MKQVSGTSQATALLAGIASMILHIPRMWQYRENTKPWLEKAEKIKHKLKKASNMSIVLYRCMTSQQRAPDYDCIVPAMLFDEHTEEYLPRIGCALQVP